MHPALYLAVSALLLLPAAAYAQCADPSAPQGGFAVTRQLDQPVTYLDGARTLMDVRYPSATPGRCGWPVIIVVHTLGASRRELPTGPEAEYFTSHGYLTVAYDVRGQGAARVLNPASQGTEIIGRSERLDLAEIVALIKTRFGNGLADLNRLGITGFSQGAAHSWAAAAWSGRKLPATKNRGITTFPTFRAACPLSLAPAGEDTLTVGGRAFLQQGVQALLAPSFVLEYEPVFHAAMTKAMAKGDVAAARAVINTDPWRQDLALLRTSTVPVMTLAQWNDPFAPVEISIRALDAMPKSTPTRAFLSTYAGHDSPFNFRQFAQGRSLAVRWFDRFLKGIRNQVDTEPRFVSGAVPGSLSEYQNPNSLPWHRYTSTWPATGSSRRRFYLRQGQVLHTSAPTTAEAPEKLQHRVATGWDMAKYIAGGANSTNLPTACPLDSKSYDSPPLKDSIEIFGSPSVVLEVSPQASSADYQIHCALYQVPANGPERFLQDGVALITGNSRPQKLTIDIGDLDCYVPAGDKLRLRIENLTQRALAGSPPSRRITYLTVPFFVNATVDIEHSVARPSWLEIPVATTIQPALTSPTLEYDTRTAADITFNIDGTPRRSGGSYLLAFGASGLSPGTKLPLPGSGTALLNTDAVTTGLAALLGTSFLPNAIGTLDATGRTAAQPRMALRGFPALGSLVGLRLNAIAIVKTGNQLLASNPLDVIFR